MKYHNLAIKGLPVFLVALLLLSPELRAATFTYMNAQAGNDIETYSSASFSDSTKTSDDGFGAADNTNLTSFRGAAYDGTNYYTFFGSGAGAIITYTSLANFEDDSRLSTQSMASGKNFLTTNTRGIATADGSTFYALFNQSGTDLILEYSSLENLRNNTQAAQHSVSNWEVSNAVGLGYDGSSFYVAFDTDVAGGDEIREYTSLANLQDGTHTATVQNGTGAPDFDNAQVGWGLAVTPVPEPTTYALVTGLLLTGMILRRRTSRI